MKTDRIYIKKQIQRRVEFKMNERDKIRTTGVPPSINLPIVGRSNRDEIRTSGDILPKEVQISIIPKENELIISANKLSSEEKKTPISIIITAWQTQDYIEECLDSIENQTYFINNNNFEVLVGVDACQKTLNKLIEISHKYRNLRVFMMNSNMGTYVTTNTLLDLVKYENILRFDSDDVMMPEMVEEIMFQVNNYDIIMFGYYNFTENINNITDKTMQLNSEGVIFYKQHIIDLVGGYREWRCAADSEMLNRVISRVRFDEIHKPLFYRRQHENSLTNSVTTNFNSKLRKKYKKLCRHYGVSEKIIIKKIVSNYKEIDVIKSGISFCIPAYKSYNFIEECLDAIENQSCEKEILVGVDNCEDTLSKIKQISFKYKNLRVFWFSKNVGTSIVKNTLATHAKYSIISFFDSDDIMNADYSKYVINNINKNNVIRFCYQDYDNNTKLITDRNWCANGIISIFKDNFLKLNGFWEYRVTEDWDFMERWKKIGLDTQLKFLGFKRRLHNDNISYNINTGCYGDYGKNLLNISKTRCNNNEIINDNLITGKCEEIHFSINTYFDKIYCLNLDRRKNKWINVKKRLDELEICVERFPAIDGNYLTDEELRKYNKINKYEVGCVLSHYAIISDAKKNNYKKILIFEDDILITEDFHQLFNNKISKINNWKLFYLGATQWQWGDVEFINDFYYANHSDGTFAYAIDCSMYDEILGTENIRSKPIDYMLWDLQKKYYKQCYICFPNLIISDVSNSDIRGPREMKQHCVKMKWDMLEYK